MRNIIRTSHEQRRRSSAAANEQFVYHLGEQKEQLGRTNRTGLESAMLASDVRRLSSGDLPSKAHIAQLIAQEKRRSSLTGIVNNCPPPTPRRRYAEKVPLNRIDPVNMEIKNTSVLATVLIICLCCSAVVVLAYALRSYLWCNTKLRPFPYTYYLICRWVNRDVFD